MKSDMSLKKDIEEELAWDASINPTSIGVTVKDGVAGGHEGRQRPPDHRLT